MVTVRDLVSSERMKKLRMIAGANGLDREISRVSILDYEFTRGGFLAGDTWEDQFVLTSFLYTRDCSDNVISAVKRLIRIGAVGLAIRNVFRLEISQEVIRYANQYNFPIFIIDDRQLFFEDIIIHFNTLQSQNSRKETQERTLTKILTGNLGEKAIREAALEINHNFGSAYSICFLRPAQGQSEQALRHLLSQPLDKQTEHQGNSLIRFRSGAFLIHSVDQSKARDTTNFYWQKMLPMDPTRFYVGVSETKLVLEQFHVALTEAYYASCYCELYEKRESFFSELGLHQVLFHAMHGGWLETYLSRIVDPIVDYDRKNGSELWQTLLTYEQHNGSFKESAKDSFNHENTLRYRIKKIFELFGKKANDASFQSELLVAVKLYRMHELLGEDQDIFQPFQ